MSAIQTYPCLGLHFLGTCAYNPAAPSPVYFSVGSAIAALALTVAIQQFLRPIYRLRLRAYKLSVVYLIALVFLGFACAVIAALLPNLPISRGSPKAYPVVWELVGGVVISCAYAATAFISLVPARIYNFNLISFVRAGAHLLSAADETDRINFASDLLGQPDNITRLITYTRAFATADWHETQLEFERLREEGLPPSFTGNPPASAFYRFTHRVELQRASWAASFLSILADPDFCSVLVRKCAWMTAIMLRQLSEKEVHSDQANVFIQEIAKQAIVDEASMMAKETGYDGFGSAPLLSKSLFSDRFICRHYAPLARLRFMSGHEPSDGFVSRLSKASEMMLKTALSGGDYWGSYYMDDVAEVYQALFRQVGFRRYEAKPNTFMLALHMSVEALYRDTANAVAKLEPARKKTLFASNSDTFRHDLGANVASIVYGSLETISNKFLGYNDEAWLHAVGIFREVFPSVGNEDVGLNPIQQQVAIKLVAKLKHNMQGMYPAISRVLLSVIGPFDRRPPPTKRTAFVMLRDAVYRELRGLRELRLRSPDKLEDFLPSDVDYNPLQDALRHRYRDGQVEVTVLGTLNIPEVNLFDQANWQI